MERLSVPRYQNPESGMRIAFHMLLYCRLGERGVNECLKIQDQNPESRLSESKAVVQGVITPPEAKMLVPCGGREIHVAKQHQSIRISVS